MFLVKRQLPSVQRFGEALGAWIDAMGYDPADAEDHEAFGMELAKYRVPSRSFPYAPEVIEGWLSGALLPGYADMAALKKIWETNASETKQPIADDVMRAYNGINRIEVSADQKLDAYAGEFAYMLRVCVSRSLLSYSTLSYETGLSPTCFNGYMNAKESPTPDSVRKIVSKLVEAGEVIAEKRFSHKGVNVPAARSLAALYDDAFKQRSYEMWERGLKTGNIGQMLTACRQRYDASMEDYARDLCVKAMWHYYERDQNIGDVKGIPAGEANRGNIFQHMLLADARARDALGEKLGIVCEPWLTSDVPETVIGNESLKLVEEADTRKRLLREILVEETMWMDPNRELAGREKIQTGWPSSKLGR